MPFRPAVSRVGAFIPIAAIILFAACEPRLTPPDETIVAGSPPVASEAGPPRALIYYGNGSRYGNANSTGVLGYTHIAATWTGAGVVTSISNQWPADVASYRVVLLAEPTIPLTVGQIADISALLENGGTLVISDEADNPTVDNALLSALGTEMQIADFSGFLTLTASITDLTRYSKGIPTGTAPFCMFHPGRVTGGVNIVEHPAGRGVVAAKQHGNGTVIVGADADVFLNVAYLWFQWTPQCIANLRQFHLNIVEPHLDDSPPIVEPAVTGTLGSNDWYVSDVDIAWEVSDPESGIASRNGCATLILATDTDGETFLCSATNGVGRETARSIAIKRDATPPVLSLSAHADVFTVSQQITINCSVADETSGVAATTCANLSWPAHALGVGTHDHTFTATDNAGNAASRTTSFQVIVTASSLCELTKAFVSPAGLATSLCAKLSAAERSAERGNLAARAGQIGAYVSELNAQTGKGVSPSDAQTLIGLAGSWQ